MATRHGRRRPFARLRCDTLEPRITPAATPVINFGSGFTEAAMPGGLPAGYADGNLLLTDGPYQARAVWAPTRVDVRSFQTSFVFHQDGQPERKGDGFTFALTGTGPPAAGAVGGGLGYQGLTDSVAIKFDLVDNAGEGRNSVGLFTDGAEPTTPAVTLDGTPIDLDAGHAIRADLAYDGAVRTLTLTLTDTTAPDHTWTHEFAVDIPAALRSSTAFAGFTAGTGELFARQAIDTWTYAEGIAEAPRNRPPEITTAAWASWLSPSGVMLAVGATDDGGADNLTYTWEVVSAPDGSAPQISQWAGAGSPDASVTLDRGGRYTFRVTVRDGEGQTTTSEVRYTDPLSVPDFEVSPQSATIPAGGTVRFETVVRDASGSLSAEPIAPSWRVASGPGIIDVFGRYTAPTDASGPVIVQAVVPASSGRSFFWKTVESTVLVTPTAAPAGPVNLGGGFAGADLARNGSAQMAGSRLRLADAPYQAGSAYAPTPVDVRGFTTSFRFQVGDAPSWWHGDGLTFVLQNAGPTAVGVAGGGLGSEGIAKSVAVKFDLVDNAGEGTDSVGVFTGGAAPTTPADRLPTGQGGAIHLNSGYMFRANLAFADGTLRLELWDTVTGLGFRRSYAVDVPAAVGGPTAYAGFTAGTGELFAPIEILDWTYTPTQEWGPAAPADGDPSITVDVSVGAGTGIITTVAGNGTQGYGGDGGPAADAPLNSPTGVAVDAAGNLYIADQANLRVRRVDAATGVITTVAGTGVPDHNGDGIAASAANLGYPLGVAVDATGNLYITETGNNRVRKVDAATGLITTVAGTGGPGYSGDGGLATSAAVGFPRATAVDAAGNLFIADANNNRVRRVDAATGVITTVAGTGEAGYGGDAGPATDAALNEPFGVAVDPAGNLFIADQHNNRVRRVDVATGVITTVAGTGVGGYGGDGGPAASAVLLSPTAVAVDDAGNLFISDSHNMRVRRVDAATGVITTVAGTGTGTGGFGGDGGPATEAALNYPFGLAVDAAGNLFFADTSNHRIRKVAVDTVREGDTASYTFTVRNTSPASTDPVTVTSVADTVLGDLTAVARAANGGAAVVLAPGASFTFSAASPPLDPGTVVSTVTVTAHDDEGTTATASDTETVIVT